MSEKKYAVVGLGAIGSMAVWRMAKRGLNVSGFEQFELGHDRGAYGGYSRQFPMATHDGRGTEHLRLARRAMELWAELEVAADLELYRPTGHLVVGPSEDGDVRSLLSCLRSEDLEHEVLDPRAMASRFPQHRLGPEEVGVYARRAGLLRSNEAVRAAIACAERLGAHVVSKCPIRAVEHVGGQVRITTESGETSIFDHVVVTAGPWVGELVGHVQDLVQAREIVTVWLEAPVGEAWGPDAFPPGFRRSRAGHSFTYLPALDGRGVKLIYWIPYRPKVSSPGAWVSEGGSADVVAQTSQAVAATLNMDVGQVEEVSTYIEGFTPDRWPVVGCVQPGISVLAGFSGGGFKLAPVMGDVAADLAVTGHSDHGVEGMSLDRAFS